MADCRPGSSAVLPPRRSAAALAMTATFIALLVAGCGGGSYTTRDFIRRADGVCLSTTRAVRSLTPPGLGGSPAQTQRSTAAYLARVAPLVRSEARRLASLPKPPTTRRQRNLMTRWLSAVRDSGVRLGQLAAAMRDRHPASVAADAAALAALPVVRLAGEVGVHACADPGTSYRYSANA